MRYLILLGLGFSFALAECPRIGPEDFRDILNNDHRKIDYDGARYHIKDRNRVKHGIESSKLPRVIIKDHGKTCKYTRMIGKKKFGSFILKKDPKKSSKHKYKYNHKHKKVVVVE